MIGVALKGLAKRKLRAALTAIAIVLGVAMISGSFVLTDTISKAFDTLFTSAYDKTDAVVSGKKLVDYSSSGNATVSPAVLAKVRALPEVAAAAPSIIDMSGDSTQAKLIDHDGTAIQSSGNPTFGVGIDPSQPRFNPMHLTAGRWATGANEVVIDAETARKHHFAVGETIGVAGKGPRTSFRITGLAQYGDVASLGGATFAVFSLPTARRVLRLDGYSSISVAAADGVSQSKLIAALDSVVPPSAQVKTADEQAAADEKGVSTFVSFIRGFLLGFGGLALFVGSFVIFNTLSITVAQRTRELATLRTLGASRRQVRRLVVLESLAIGLFASVVGLFAGFGLARGLSALFSALGLALPEASPVYALRTVLVSLLVGVGVTVAAGLGPAIRATRVPPISAVREGAVPQKAKSTRLALALLAAGVAVLGWALFGGQLGSGKSFLALAGGTLLLIVGVAQVASKLVGALAAVVGLPARRLGGAAGQLAYENAIRNPARTAATAAALMIGLTLVSFVAVLGTGVHGSIDRALRQQVDADWVVTSKNGWSGFPTAAGDSIATALPGARVTSVRGDRGLIGKTQVNVNSVDPATLDGMVRFAWKDGSDATLRRLGGSGALVKKSFANANGLHVGDAFTLRSSSGKPVALTVAGIFQPPRVMELLGGVVVSQTAFDRAFPRPANKLTLVSGGSVSRSALERAVAAFPDTKVSTEAEYVKDQSAFMTIMLNLLYVLLALSVVVSLFGMINTLVLSVFERTRELGMLRAVGMTRRQARRMIRQESVITSLIGAALGLPLGIGLAAAVTHAIAWLGIGFAVPVGSLVAFVVVAVAAGLLAAVAPARRAGRLDVLAALQYE